MFKLITSLVLVLTLQPIANGQEHYQLDSRISEHVTVSDITGKSLSLQKIIADSGAELSVVFIFGGGAMGHHPAEKNGGLWCPDSYEDMHIVRSLYNHYKDKSAIIPVAVPPVFHSQLLGYEKEVFFTDKATPEYQKAIKSFVDSTKASFRQGIIPVQPLYDNDFNLLISQQQGRLSNKLNSVKQWHGAFRAENESQHYGMPNLWLVDSTGKIIAEPFRGNVYRPHDGGIRIKYTLNQVVAVIDAKRQ
jgi:hypothetical protein